MRKIVVFSVLLAMLAVSPNAHAWKKNKKYEKQVVTIEQAAPQELPKPVVITQPAKQLYGEWTIIEVRKKEVFTQERPYIYLDFNGDKIYGNNGCNSINGGFALQGSNISFNNIISTRMSCHSTTPERTIMKALAEVQAYSVTSLYNVEYLNLKNAKGIVVMVLRRQNLDFLNGAWLVKEMGGTNVSERNVRVVIDVQMLTVNALTKCNIINGIVKIDPRKEFDVEFEDLKSSHNQCDDINTETQMLINMEETVSCKKINDSEMALLDHKGAIVIVLKRIDLKAERERGK